MSKFGVLVFEKRPRWTPELQRQFDGEDVRVRDCRVLADLVRHATDLADGNTGQTRHVIVLDLALGTADCLQFLGSMLGRPERPAIIVVGSDATAELEWPIRELGAVGFVDESTTGEQLAQLCRRSLETMLPAAETVRWSSSFSLCSQPKG